MAPMGRMFANDHVPHEAAAAYYRRRAEGGVGLIITEATGIDHRLLPDHGGIPIMGGDLAPARWRQVVDQVHQAGGKIMLQLFHQGMLRGGSIGDGHMESLRPSGTIGEAGPNSYAAAFVEAAQTPTAAMSDSDIQEAIDGFCRSAALAKTLGFDGIEIHGAHGYLIDSFLWVKSNTRNDHYGGNIHRRTNLAVEIVKKIRQEVGKEYPLFFRFSQHKSHNYAATLANTPDELEQYLGPIADAGVDVLDASMRRFYQPAFEGSPLNLAGWAKKLTGKPSIAVGSVGLNFTASDTFLNRDGLAENNIPLLMERFNQGEFDLVSIGRSLISDPDYVNKLKTGEAVIAFSKEALNTLI
jgi:2,4-dienoyl-CoA reductase-like NADH-dependent reductase (Old Yellow Enzyme family)